MRWIEGSGNGYGNRVVGRGALALVTAALLATGVACGSDGGGEVASGSNTPTTVAGASAADEAFEPVDTIVIKNFEFEPARPAAKVGDTITVRNEDSALHSVTAKEDRALFDSGQFTGGERQITLTKAGTFDFACSVHPFMSGIIQVSA